VSERVSGIAIYTREHTGTHTEQEATRVRNVEVPHGHEALGPSRIEQLHADLLVLVLDRGRVHGLDRWYVLLGEAVLEEAKDHGALTDTAGPEHRQSRRRRFGLRCSLFRATTHGDGREMRERCASSVGSKRMSERAKE